MRPEVPPDWSGLRAQLDPAGYDERWRRMAAAGENPHGEVDLVCGYEPQTVLDAGCGTGRVAIELASRGIEVVGTDLDPDMIDCARSKAPTLTWVPSDLSELDLPKRFDVVVLAGNVVPFVAADRRQACVLACARHLAPEGRLVAGFQLLPDWPTLEDYDGWCAAAGLRLEARYATWERQPYPAAGNYAVSVHGRSRPSHV